MVRLTLEIDRETDGRWIAEVIELPGVLTYGATQGQAIEGAQMLAREVIEDRVEHGEMSAPDHLEFTFEFVRAA